MRARATAALTLALVGLAAGCGADDEGKPIPRRFAVGLEHRLDRLESAVREGGVDGCRQATSLENQLQQIADAVPQNVDAQVRDALQRSLDHLFELLARECEGVDQTETETTPTETETVPTETETVPTETVTTPTETTPTETVPTETQPPQTTPDGNSGGGGAGVPGDGG